MVNGYQAEGTPEEVLTFINFYEKETQKEEKSKIKYYGKDRKRSTYKKRVFKNTKWEAEDDKLIIDNMYLTGNELKKHFFPRRTVGAINTHRFYLRKELLKQ